MKRVGTVLVVAILAVSFFYRQPLSAADTDFPIYFENSTLANPRRADNDRVLLGCSEYSQNAIQGRPRRESSAPKIVVAKHRDARDRADSRSEPALCRHD